ncbi:MAG: hypothetical protein KBT20_02540 [Bacteroidales bacterium]|nr:hypothetical protein [Candidatus Liminaster caballi]
MEQIWQWMEKPESMGAEAVDMLPQLIGQYPYCAAYRLLYTIALANTHSTKFTGQLPLTATAMPDRAKLFTLINNGEHEWVSLMQQLRRQRSVQDSIDDFALIDQYLEQNALGGQSGTSAQMPAYDISELSNAPAPYFDDDMDIVQNEENKSDDIDSLIDSFIQADEQGLLFVPKAQKKQDELPVADPENIREKAFLTESLAKLYVKQHKFEQALAIFSTLNLKYSKKNTYFADQIRYLEKVIAYQKEKQSQVKG